MIHIGRVSSAAKAPKLTIAAVKTLRDRARETLKNTEWSPETKDVRKTALDLEIAASSWLRARRNTTSGNASRVSDEHVARLTNALAAQE